MKSLGDNSYRKKPKSALDLHFQEQGVTQEKIEAVNKALAEILNKAGEKHDNM